MRCQPDRFRKNNQRSFQNGLFDARQHERIVNPAGAALNVLPSRTGMSAPRRTHQSKDDSRPLILSNHSVTEPVDTLVKNVSCRRISFETAGHGDRCRESSPQFLIAEFSRLSQKLFRTGCIDRHFGTNANKGFTGEQRRVFIRLYIADQRPGQRPVRLIRPGNERRRTAWACLAPRNSTAGSISKKLLSFVSRQPGVLLEPLLGSGGSKRHAVEHEQVRSRFAVESVHARATASTSR